ncbi:peptidase [Egicoccus sp. AB-alg6-2]|uniref:peptidase n=1 Tax=Egicoccus sp. AB-alg6-2 TaxID=3242692 RepID=UPI00359E3952
MTTSPTSAPEPAADAPSGPRPGAVVTLLALAALVAAGVAAVGVTRGLPATADTGGIPHHAEPGVEAAGGYAVWAYNDDGRPIRWDPCTPIDIVVAPEGAPPGTDADLERAIAEVGRHSGLHLRVMGETDERPAARRSAYQPRRYGSRWAPVLLAWAAPHENGLSLRDTDRGLAIPVAVGHPGARVYVTGQVVLNAERDDLEAGFGDRADAWGATLLHELSHLVGLAHVEDRDQLMSVHPGEGPVTLGSGDRAGLAAIGAEHGCLDVPPPRDVEVAPPPQR